MKEIKATARFATEGREDDPANKIYSYWSGREKGGREQEKDERRARGKGEGYDHLRELGLLALLLLGLVLGVGRLLLSEERVTSR